MIDENSPGNLLFLNEKNSVVKPAEGRRRASRDSTEKAGNASAPGSNKKRGQENSPAKSVGKRKDVRDSPASKTVNVLKDRPGNRRETVDAADLAGLLDDLDSSVTSVGSLLDTSTASSKGKKSSKKSVGKKGPGDDADLVSDSGAGSRSGSRRSSRLSEVSMASVSASDISSSSMPSESESGNSGGGGSTNNRRSTIDPADIDALLNDSTTSSQLRYLTTASPIPAASKAAAGAKSSGKGKDKGSRGKGRLSTSPAPAPAPSSPSPSSSPAQSSFNINAAPKRDSDASEMSALTVGEGEKESGGDGEPIHDAHDYGQGATTHVEAEVEVDAEVLFNSSGSAADVSYDDRRTTVDAADLQMLLDDDEDATHTSSRRFSSASVARRSSLISAGRPSLGATARLSMDGGIQAHSSSSGINVRRITADAMSLMEAMLDERSDDDCEGSGSAQNVHAAPTAAGTDVTGKSPARNLVPKAVQSMVDALLSQDFDSGSPINPVSAVNTSTASTDSAAATYRPLVRVANNSKGRRASMATSTVQFRSALPSAPRRTTADLADLRELAQELAKQHEHEQADQVQKKQQQQEQQEKEKEQNAPISIPAAAAVAALSPARASATTLEQQAQQPQPQEEEDEEEEAQERDSIISLGALISRRGTIETSFNSSFAGDSRRGSRLSFQPPLPLGADMDVDAGEFTAHSPTASGHMQNAPQALQQSALKSCLSTKKAHGGSRLSVGSARKNVIFGSPKAMEFTRDAPTASMTPLARSEAKSLFSMVGSVSRLQEEDDNAAEEEEEEEDVHTRDNSAILEEWDRLTNPSNGSDEETDEFPLPPTPVLPGTPEEAADALAPRSGSGSSDSQLLRSPRRRSSGRLPPPLNLTPALAEAEDDSFQRAERQAAEEADTSRDAAAAHELSTSQSEVTATVHLPADFAELMAQNDVYDDHQYSNAYHNTSVSRGAAFIAQHRQSLDTSNLSIASDESRTMPLELDLQGVLRHVDYAEAGVDIDTSTTSHESALTVASEGSGHSLGGVLGMSASATSATSAVHDPSPTGKYANMITSAAAAQADISPCVSDAQNMSVDGYLTGTYNHTTTATRFSFAPSPLAAAATATAAPAAAATGVRGAMRREVVVENSTESSPAELSAFLSASAYKSASLAGVGSAARPTSAVPSLKVHPTPSAAAAASYAAGSSLFMPSSADNKRAAAAAIAPAPTGAASAMLSRLRNLNDETRRHTLSQSTVVGTPGASRLTMGAKRNALVTSASKAFSETKRLRMNAAALQAAGATISGWHDDPEVSVLGGGGGIQAEEEDVDTSADTVQDEGGEAVASPVKGPSPQREPVLDVSAVLRAAQWDISADVNNDNIASSACGLRPTLKKAKQLCAQRVFSKVMDAMRGSVSTAVKQQAAEAPADMRKLEQLWAGASAEAHAHVRELHRSVTSLPSRGSPRLDTAKDTLLVSLGKQCKQLVAKRWCYLEGELIDVGTTAVEEMRKVIRQRTAQIRQETQALRQATSTMMEPSDDVQRTKLMQVQKRIQEAREKLDRSRAAADAFSDETSSLLEQRKQALVLMAQDTSHRAANEDFQAHRLEQQQEQISAEWSGLAETQKTIGVLNRLSTYRTVQYQTTGIEIEVALTAQMRARVYFALASGHAGLEVSNVDVDLVDFSEAGAADDNENAFAKAFYLSYMGSNIAAGPLSESTLAQVDSPREIPNLLQKISGQVFALRRALASLSVFSTDGYSWNLIGDEVVATFPGQKYQLRFPMSQVLSGGVSQLTPHALRSTATGDAVAEYPMKAVVSSLRMRYGPAERGPFQPFPARAVRKEVEAIVKLM